MLPKVRDTAIIQSLDRGLRIFEEILSSGRTWRLNEVAQTFDIDRASAHRFLATLDRFGIVHKDLRTKEYGLGPKFLSWISQPKVRLGLVDLAKPFLKQMAADTGQEAHLGVLSEEAVILVDTAAPAAPISVRSMIGLSEPLHCTALGKAIFAFLPEVERDALLQRIALPALTPDTIVDRQALRAHLDQVRREGIATDDGEHIDILTCFACPIIGVGQQPVGSMGISLIRMSLSDGARRQALKAKVSEIAASFSRAMAAQERELKVA